MLLQWHCCYCGCVIVMVVAQSKCSESVLIAFVLSVLFLFCLFVCLFVCLFCPSIAVVVVAVQCCQVTHGTFDKNTGGC